MNMRKLTAVAAFAAGYTLSAAVPEVTGVTMSQDDTRLVTITYSLADAPAVVTVDVQTNNEDNAWFSIGGEAVQNAKGDVWKKVETGAHTITWRPDLSWPDHMIADGGARAVVTAWALDNTPDYMVVDVSESATAESQKYYPAVEFLPGGLLDNGDYRRSKVVMRKIMAKNIEWTMGSTTLETKRNKDREATHQVKLGDNYYIGVFPVTQAQWALVETNPTYAMPSSFNNTDVRAMRPVESVSYNEIRNAANSTTADTTYDWPNDPNPGSFLGKLRTKTGLDFDLPSEAQWEFAARAGHGDTEWGDGSAIKNSDTDANLGLLGRYERNGGKILQDSGYVNPDNGCGPENGTSIVGSYAPNDWGLYDMHGNVFDWCLDKFEDNISGYEGAVNNTSATSSRVKRGGAWNSGANSCRPAFRISDTPESRRNTIGFRLVCTAGLQ